jgi:vitamin B12 transporter
MRFHRVFVSILVSVLFLVVDASAAEIKVRVVDPQAAVVAGAQVTLFAGSGSTPLAVEDSSPEGTVVFRSAGSGPYRLQVLAPGFAAQTLDVASSAETVTVNLKLAPAAETVVVTATRTPVEAENSGADVATLNGDQLNLLQPVAANDALRFLPGAIVNTAGQRGGLGSLFVRGGDSTYNKVIVDGVTINQPGGTFDFGTLPLGQADHLEFLRGAQSTLYGTDAMTSVVQVWTSTGTTATPQLTLGADGGNFGTANGYLSLSGARGRFDYNVFGSEFATNGEGVNNHYSDALQGGNLGAKLDDHMSLRVRLRHSNSYAGEPGSWNFNGDPLEPPDPHEWSHYNTLLGSVELSINEPSGWQHRFTGFDYTQRYADVNLTGDPARFSDFPADSIININRAGFEYQGDYIERSWAHTTFGYRFEDENGFFGDLLFPPLIHGLRLNDDIYGQQQIIWKRISVIAGARFVHNGAFGNTGVPRVAVTFLALRGGQMFSGTRLRFSYSGGFKEPGLDQSYASLPDYVPNPGLKPERTRAFEAGFLQGLLSNRYAFTATYFNNLFYNRIDFINNPAGVAPYGQFVNVDKSFAQGVEAGIQGTIRPRLLLNAAYTYTSTEILAAPVCTPANFCDPTILGVGRPLLRRPKHSATTLLSYLGNRWSGNLGASFVGRRFDSDFDGFGIYHAAGYVRVDIGGSYKVNSRMTAYMNVGNILDKQYNEVVGYPALGTNFRAGMRFRIGGEK